MRVLAPPYGDLWKVARLDVNALEPDRQQEIFGWLTGLGIAYRDYRPELVVSQDRDTRAYALHLTRYVLAPDGSKFIDHAAGRVHTEPVVFAITDYPEWLPEVAYLQEKEGQP